jgi:hypothetical protein
VCVKEIERERERERESVLTDVKTIRDKNTSRTSINIQTKTEEKNCDRKSKKKLINLSSDNKRLKKTLILPIVFYHSSWL